MKLSCQEMLVPGKGLEEKFKRLKDLGFDKVEFWGRNFIDDADYEKQVARALKASGLAPAAICAGYRGCLLSQDPGQRKLAAEDIELLLGVSGRLGCDGLIVVPIFGPPQLPDLSPLFSAVELEKDLLVEVFKPLAARAAEAKTRIILEPLNRGETHLLNTLDQAREILDAVGSPALVLMGDFFHMNIEELSIPAAFTKHAGVLGYVHLADNTRKQPGTGMTDFAGGIAVLKQAGYEGTLSLECGFTSGDRLDQLRQVAVDIRGMME